MDKHKLIFKLLVFVFLVFFSVHSIADNNIELQQKCSMTYPYEETIERCSKLIQLDPDNSEAFLSRGWAKYLLKNFNSAILDFNQVILLSPDNSKAYYLRGASKLKLSDYIGAIYDYSMSIEFEPNNGDGYFSRGIAKSFLDDYRGALVDFNKAVELSSHGAYLYRGLVKFNLKDFRGAILDLDQAIMQGELFLSNKKEINSNLSKDVIANLQKLQKDLDEIIKEELAKAYLFRGMSKIIINEKNAGCLDLSKAGELGHENAYDFIQKYCN